LANEEPWQVMARADDALYRAKREGRDRAEISIGPPA
jgi:PleD family two-component response regulator